MPTAVNIRNAAVVCMIVESSLQNGDGNATAAAMRMIRQAREAEQARIFERAGGPQKLKKRRAHARK